MKSSYIASALVFATMAAANAAPIEYKKNGFALRLSGYGNIGLIEPDFLVPNARFIGDWSARAQMTYDINNGHRVGLVYSLNQKTLDDGDEIDDLFALWQVKNYGRLEVGLTDSVAKKLGLGLPDVGGLRLNDNPLFYKRIEPNGMVISDTTLDTGDGAVRVNAVSSVNNGIQYGVSVADLTDNYDFTVDSGIKIRRPNGKTKTAYSLGASFTNAPDDFRASPWARHVTADWRAQAAAAVNVQYNSWMFALTGRVIYDKNPVGEVSDGFIVGTGLSYDFLKYSISLSYSLSDTGVWQHDVDDFLNHVVMSSFRYKYSENVDGWISIGMTTETPFVSAGMRLTF